MSPLFNILPLLDPEPKLICWMTEVFRQDGEERYTDTDPWLRLCSPAAFC